MESTVALNNFKQYVRPPEMTKQEQSSVEVTDYIEKRLRYMLKQQYSSKYGGF